jgi:hypothetical protein
MKQVNNKQTEKVTKVTPKKSKRPRKSKKLIIKRDRQGNPVLWY